MYSEKEVIDTKQLFAGGDEMTILFAVRGGHPLFEEHFPGNPVLPGSFMASYLLNCCEAAWGGMAELAELTFTERAVPGQTYRATLRKKDGRVRFQVLNAATGKKTSAGTLRTL